MSGIKSMKDMRDLTTEGLYELMFTCQSPGYYQFCVEELQRRFLNGVALQTEKLAKSSSRLETLTENLAITVGDVGTQIESLTKSSNKMERLTKWLTGLTIALLLLTVLQVAVTLKDEFALKNRANTAPSTVPAPVRPKDQQSQKTRPRL